MDTSAGLPGCRVCACVMGEREDLILYLGENDWSG